MDEQPRLPRNVWILTFTSFLTDVSSEMIFNLLPFFLANVLGASTLVIGLIDGLAETTASLLKAVSGWLSDKLRQRKNLAVLGYGLSALSKPFLYFANTWGWVLVLRFSDRIGKGIRTSPRDALIADSIAAEQRGLAFGLHRAGDTAGAVLGLVIAFIVVLATQANALDLSPSTFQLLVLIASVPGILAVLLLAFAAKDVPIIEKSGEISLSFRTMNPKFKLFLGVMTIFTLGNSSDAFILLRAQERGLTIAGVLGMLICFNIIYASLSTPLGVLSDRVGRNRLLFGGWLVYALLYFGFAFADSAWQVWLIFALYGIYYAAVEGTAKALVADLVEPEQRGTAYGIYNGTIGLMALPASLLAGALWQGFGDWAGFGASAPFLFGGTLALVAAIIWGFSLQSTKLLTET